MDLYYSLSIDKNELRTQIAKEIRDKVNRALLYSRSNIQFLVRREVEKELKAGDEYLAMLPGGELYGQIGLVDIEDTLDGVIEATSKQVKVQTNFVKLVGDQVNASIWVIVDLQYAKLYAIGEAKFVSPEGGYDVDWLKWLLESGTSAVVLEYDYFENDRTRNSRWSRTGTGFMREREGKSWGFYEPYAGTQDDNWITRAINRTANETQKILESELQFNLGQV